MRTIHVAVPALLSVIAFTATASAAPNLKLRNAGAELFQHIAEVDVQTHLALAPPGGNTTPQVTDAEGRSVAAQYAPAREGRPAALLVLCEGLFGRGEERLFAVEWTGKAAEQPSTDLNAADDEQQVITETAYYGLVQPKAGGGGFPTEVRFPQSGTTERGFTYEDRLFDKERGFLRAANDPNATVERVLSGPLVTEIEQRFTYPAPQGKDFGGPGATYTWRFRAGSPLVRVTGDVSRQGDADFNWPELHFLQISRNDQTFDRLGGGEPLKTFRLEPPSEAWPLSEWAFMSDGTNALGVAMPGGVGVWDGTTEYVTYMQKVTDWSGPSKRFEATLYLGPARAAEEIQAALMAQPNVVAEAIEMPAPAAAPAVEGETLQNDRLAITIAPEEDGLGVVQLAAREPERAFLSITDDPPLIFRLKLRDEAGEELELDNTAPSERKLERAASKFTLTWTGLDIGEEADVLDVRAEISLDPPGDRATTSQWRLFVDNRSAKWSLWEIRFPAFSATLAPGELELAVPRSNWGRRSTGREAGSYPSANWPMQFLCATGSDGQGIYLGCHDPGAGPKRFDYSPGGQFHFLTNPEDMGVPGNDFQTPGTVEIGCYDGTWADGCKLYRRWALKEAPWTRRGPIAKDPLRPKPLKELGLWMISSGTREEVVPPLLEVQKIMGVPIGVHWYSWHWMPFDTHYPKYFPPKEGFDEGVAELTRAGIIAMPYINGRLWDQTIPSFQTEGLPFAAKNAQGEHYTEVYGNGVKQAPMCAATEFWQQTITEVVRTLVEEHGVTGVYLDQIAAAGPALCFDKTHGHPLGGGRHWVDGYREMLRGVNDVAHRDGREIILTTENPADPYMDGVDCFLIWNPRVAEEVPMMTAVYSGYTVYFASPALTSDLQAFRMVQGRDFIWGCQLGWISPTAFLGEQNAGVAEYLSRLGHYRLAARKYVMFGEFLDEIEPLNELPTLHATWRGWRESLQAELPAAMGAAWLGDDGTLGLMFANFSDATQEFSYELDPKLLGRLGGGKYLVLTRIAPEGRTLAGAMLRETPRRTEYLRGGEILVLEAQAADGLPEVEGLAEAERADFERLTEPRAGAAARGALDLWCLRHGVAWSLELPKRVAEDDGAPAVLDVINRGGGRISTKLAVYAPAASPSGGSSVRAASGTAPSHQLETRVFAAWSVPGEDWYATVKIGNEEDSRACVIPFRVATVPRVELVFEAGEAGFRAGEASAFRLLVTNNGSQPTDATALVRTPPGWELWPGPIVPAAGLQPGETRAAWLKARLDRDAEAGPAALQALVISDRAAERVEVAPPRPEAGARRLPQPPGIDGDLSEWMGEPAFALGGAAAANVTERQGDEDLSAKVWLGWDDQALYLAAEVIDDTFAQEGRDQTIWQGDCLQLAFRPGAPPSGSRYDRVTELGLALTPEGPQIWQWMPQERDAPGSTAAVANSDGRIRYEAKIAWSDLAGIGPDPRAPIGFSMTVNESDGDQFGGWLEWAGGVCGGKDASRFGRLILRSE